MKTKFRELIWLFVALLCVTACDEIEATDPSITQLSGVTFSAQMNALATKAADTTFESGDQIAVTAYTSDGSIHQSNVSYSYESSSFTSSSPISYSSTVSELEFRALYPFVEISSDKTTTFSAYTNQSSGTNYTLSDLMFGYAALTSAESPQLTFDHLMTKIVVNITYSDVDMAGSSTSLTALTDVEYDLTSFVSSAVGSAQTVTMASNGTNSYKAIIAPQTIDSSAPFGAISTMSGSYEFYVTSATDLQGGSQYTINASIENGEITFDSPIINEWNDGEFGEDNGDDDGENDVDERSILEKIYYATGGDNWTYNNNWCTDAPLSEWYGVTVDSETGAVTELSLYSNNLVGDMDVSGLSSLTYLDCYRNSLTALDVSNLINLTYLSCYDNSLTALDVSNLINLTELRCYSNSLTALDVSNLINLTELRCYSNSLTVLDVSNLSNLTELRCYSNSLTDLDVSNLINLTYLFCGFNSLTSLDVSDLSNLTSLFCEFNSLTVLDVSNLSNLTTLSCESNSLTVLDVSNLSNLTELSCSSNSLTVLDVSNLINLTYLICSSNTLTSLDVSNLINLTDLRCYSNSLTVLDVSNLINLTYLICYSNSLTVLDVSNLINLTYLSCYDNSLTSLDVSKSSGLKCLYCQSNYLTSIYLHSIQANFYYTSWGDYNTTLYTEPTHRDGYQYPEFYYQ